MRRLLILLSVLLASPVLAITKVDGVRVWNAPDHTRVVFDTSGPVEHKIIVLKKPDRVVVDFSNVSMTGLPPNPSADDKLLERIRSAARDKTDLRVVLDLKQPVRPRSFPLKPNEHYSHRLVIDLAPVEENAKPVIVKSAPKSGVRDLVVAVDAGHGGEDPGAIGARGHREKDVVLAIAQKLAKKINATPGMRAVMIRTGDYFIGLTARREKARKARADLFVSIHADAFTNRAAHGASVFTLSQGRASSEAARWLAKRENAADLVGGVPLSEMESQIRELLMDLSLTATIGASQDVASSILSELGGFTDLHKSDVQRAGFKVLTSPDVPSVLIETAFISNRAEERRLADPKHQEKLANAILKGVKSYFASNPIPGSYAIDAPREHRVRRGETLTAIASIYDVSVHSIRKANGKNSDRLAAGELLKIP